MFPTDHILQGDCTRILRTLPETSVDYASSRSFLEARHEQAYLLAKGRPAKPAQPLSDVRPWEYSGNTAHPTEKAVSVLRPLIESFSKPGDLLDPFAGSGSTCVAAAECGRRYLGIELEARYCDLARERLAQLAHMLRSFASWAQARGLELPADVLDAARRRTSRDARTSDQRPH